MWLCYKAALFRGLVPGTTTILQGSLRSQEKNPARPRSGAGRSGPERCAGCKGELAAAPLGWAASGKGRRKIQRSGPARSPSRHRKPRATSRCAVRKRKQKATQAPTSPRLITARRAGSAPSSRRQKEAYRAEVRSRPRFARMATLAESGLKTGSTIQPHASARRFASGQGPGTSWPGTGEPEIGPRP